MIAAKFREHFREAPPTTCTRQPIIFVANVSVIFVEKKFVKGVNHENRENIVPQKFGAIYTVYTCIIIVLYLPLGSVWFGLCKLTTYCTYINVSPTPLPGEVGQSWDLT